MELGIGRGQITQKELTDHMGFGFFTSKGSKKPRSFRMSVLHVGAQCVYVCVEGGWND